VLGAKDDAAIKKLFQGDDFALQAIEKTLLKDHDKNVDDAFVEVYKKLRDGDMATAENAKEFVNSIFDKERYDLSPSGRHFFNKRFGKGTNQRPRDGS
jgi:DNA-directed RNA polymerase subunit beta